jgi:lysophospholipase L1-like esterase
MRQVTIKVAATKPTPRRFYLVLWSLPLILLLLLEGLLRLAGFGASYPLFVPAPEPGYLQPNPLLVRRYVDDPRQAPPVAPDSQYFLAEKPEAGLRLVVAGESTAAGFPYGRFGSPAALLQQRLKQQAGDKQIEVISTAMAAINSYTVLDIMPELLAVQPDAIVLYLGHNEYVGLLGVGSQFQASPNRQLTLWWLQLKQWRLYQLVQQLLQAVLPAPDRQSGQTTMAQMASQSGIALSSEAYQAGVQQFRDNLSEISELAREAGVPLLLTTLVSNELEYAPFLADQSQSLPPLDPELSAAAALQQLPALLKTAPEDALLYYRYGQALLANRQPEAAQQALQQAKDLDFLRFRAPTEFNQLLREQSKTPGIWLADAETLFRQHSQDGILGAELLLEHVHPNQRGYQLLADSWWRSLSQAGLLRATPGSDTVTAQTPTNLLSVLDLVNANYKIAMLLADYPFDQHQQQPPPSLAEFTSQLPQPALQQLAAQLVQGGDWLSLHQQLLNFYQQQRDAPHAAKVAALLSDALPFKADIAFAAGQFYFMAGDVLMARFYHWRALQLQPTDVQYRLMLARTLASAGDVPSALAQLALILQQQPDHQVALQQQARLKAAFTPDEGGTTP